VDDRRRKELTRLAAPAAFLAAVTIAVLLIKSGLGGADSARTTTAVVLPTVTTAAKAPHRRRGARTVGARYYTIQSGDTLGVVAFRLHTTVEDLIRLNPGIDPRSLHSGQRIRVG
jgi:LysM repeat protein